MSKGSSSRNPRECLMMPQSKGKTSWMGWSLWPGWIAIIITNKARSKLQTQTWVKVVEALWLLRRTEDIPKLWYCPHDKPGRYPESSRCTTDTTSSYAKNPLISRRPNTARGERGRRPSQVWISMSFLVCFEYIYSYYRGNLYYCPFIAKCLCEFVQVLSSIYLQLLKVFLFESKYPYRMYLILIYSFYR